MLVYYKEILIDYYVRTIILVITSSLFISSHYIIYVHLIIQYNQYQEVEYYNISLRNSYLEPCQTACATFGDPANSFIHLGEFLADFGELTERSER